MFVSTRETRFITTIPSIVAVAIMLFALVVFFGSVHPTARILSVVAYFLQGDSS